MAQPGPEVAVASVCLIAVLYNYEQWRDRARDGESREREKGRGRKRETWRREQKPAECHVKCIPRGDRRRGRGWREREATDREEGRGEREREMVNKRGWARREPYGLWLPATVHHVRQPFVVHDEWHKATVLTYLTSLGTTSCPLATFACTIC